jgi:hypothetical protein
MKLAAALSLSLLLAPTVTATIEEKKLYFPEDLPQNKEWVKMEDGSDFMPAEHDPKLIDYMVKYRREQKAEKKLARKRRLGDEDADDADYDAYEYGDDDDDDDGSNSDQQNDSYRDNFMDGSETFWPEGGQAFRVLGYYIDCYQQETGYKERNLEVERDMKSGSQDSQCYNGSCLRYLLWAAVSRFCFRKSRP